MRHSALFILSIFSTLPIYAATQSSAVINFDLGRSPIANSTMQPVTLFGCNNTVAKTKLFWGVQNQTMTHIPYGNFKSQSGKPYTISKYYIVSPEVAYAQSDKPVYIGLVTPDRIIFHGKNPARIVNLDYRILRPVYLQNVPVNFNYQYHGKSCADQGMTSIPINTHCGNFPWNNGALGASGIGLLSVHPASTAFLLMRKKNKDPLQCRVTLLDDVVLDHEVFFATKNGKSKTINLTRLYNESKPMNLICIPRKLADTPAGCSATP